MKNSPLGQSGIKASVVRSISILLVFATLGVSNSAKASDAKDSVPPDGGANVQLINGSGPNGTAALAQNADVLKIPFTLVRGQPLLTLKIEGQPMHILLDTGSTVTISHIRIAALGRKVRVVGAVGTGLAHNCEISIEGIRLDGVCGVQTLPGYQDGVLGTDFLQHFMRMHLTLSTTSWSLKGGDKW